jgi:hypothetical protein
MPLHTQDLSRTRRQSQRHAPNWPVFTPHRGEMRLLHRSTAGTPRAAGGPRMWHVPGAVRSVAVETHAVEA